MLLDQWRDRRHGFQLVWAFGMLCYALGAGAEAIAASSGWNEGLYRAWYLTGAIWTAGWLGLGTAFLLGRTRFGYTYAVLLLFGALLTFVIRNSPNYAGAGALPFLYLFGGIILSLAIGVETYFVNPRWTWFAGGAMIVVTVLSLVLVVLAPPLPAPGYSISATTGQPTGEAMPGYIRLLTPLPNITGGGALLLGALFSAYVFMPKKRVLAYSLDPGQKGDEFLFNLCIAVVAIPVNLVASLPGAARELAAGRLHSRVPATLLIALGAFFPTLTDSLNRAGSTDLYQLGKFLGVLFLFAGFLVSVEVFREVRIPFTSIRLGTASRERARRRDAAAREGDTEVVPPERRPRRQGGARRLRRGPGGHRRAGSSRGYALADGRVERGRPGGRAGADHGCCWSTTTRSSGAASTASSSSSTTSRSSARPRTGGVPSSSSRSSSPTSC